MKTKTQTETTQPNMKKQIKLEIKTLNKTERQLLRELGRSDTTAQKEILRIRKAFVRLHRGTNQHLDRIKKRLAILTARLSTAA